MPLVTENRKTEPEGSSETLDLGLLKELVGFNLRLAYNQAAQVFAKAFDDLDLAPIQFAALELIRCNPGCSQKEIAHHIGATPPVLVAPLERLERRGWIERHRSGSDRRRSRTQLSPEGRRNIAAVERRIRGVDRDLAARLSETERARLLQLLRKLSGML